MKTLYLLRHAKSSWKDEGLDDFDRPLSKRGRANAAAMGAYLAQHGMIPAQIICSSAKRTRETLEHLQEAFGPAVPARFEKGLYLADAPVLLRRLGRLSESLPSVMLVGHNPGLERLALVLAADADDDGLRRQVAAKFPTGSLAVIETDIARWADIAPACGRIVRFVKPRELKPQRA